MRNLAANSTMVSESFHLYREVNPFVKTYYANLKISIY